MEISVANQTRSVGGHPRRIREQEPVVESPPEGFLNQSPVTTPDTEIAGGNAEALTSPQPSSSALSRLWTRKSELTGKTIATIALVVACVGLWPAVSASVDGREATLIAKWEAWKEFVEYCEDHMWQGSDCLKARGSSVRAPPVKTRSPATNLQPDSQNSLMVGGFAPLLLIILACLICFHIRRTRRTRPQPRSGSEEPILRHAYRAYSIPDRVVAQRFLRLLPGNTVFKASPLSTIFRLISTPTTTSRNTVPHRRWVLGAEHDDRLAEVSTLHADSAIRRRTTTIRRKRQERAQRLGLKSKWREGGRDVLGYDDTSSEDEPFENGDGKSRLRQRVKRRFSRGQKERQS